MQQKQVINVTENGSARISFSDTPDYIQGLCAKGLSTCTAIVIIGSDGVSVIHDEGFLSIESIKKEFDFVGTLKEWSIFYNPKTLKEKELASRLKEMKPLLDDAKYSHKYIREDNDNLFRSTENGAITLDRNKPRVKYVNTNPDLSNIKDPEDVSLRKAVRNLNNICAHKLKEQGNTTHRLVPIDVQFDGQTEMDPPPLILPYEKAKDMVERQVNSWGDRKAMTEYSDYLTIAHRGNLENGGGGMFIQKKDPFTEFKKLEKAYKEREDQTLLLKLAKNAAELVGICADSSDWEGAEGYEGKVKYYLDLALNSSNPAVKASAKKLAREINQEESSQDENEDNKESQFKFT